MVLALGDTVLMGAATRRRDRSVKSAERPAPAADAARLMPFAVRPLAEIDVAQAAEIERDAFPELFRSTSFSRELGNKVARYLVAWRREEVESEDAPNPYAQVEECDGGGGARPRVRRLIRSAREFLHWRSEAWEPGQQYLAGFLGTWQVIDEGPHRIGRCPHALSRAWRGRTAAHIGHRAGYPAQGRQGDAGSPRV